jgi:hypothetical protein
VESQALDVHASNMDSWRLRVFGKFWGSCGFASHTKASEFQAFSHDRAAAQPHTCSRDDVVPATDCEDEMTTKKTKDLTPKSTAKVKGGGRRLNDNLTLVRASSR